MHIRSIPQEVESEAWKTSLKAKIERGISQLAMLARPPADVEEPMSLEGIVIGNALWHVDRRHSDVVRWREWQSVKGTGLAEWFEAVKRRESFSQEEFPVS